MALLDYDVTDTIITRTKTLLLSIQSSSECFVLMFDRTNNLKFPYLTSMSQFVQQHKLTEFLSVSNEELNFCVVWNLLDWFETNARKDLIIGIFTGGQNERRLREWLDIILCYLKYHVGKRTSLETTHSLFCHTEKQQKKSLRKKPK